MTVPAEEELEGLGRGRLRNEALNQIHLEFSSIPKMFLTGSANDQHITERLAVNDITVFIWSIFHHLLIIGMYLKN